MRKKALAVTVGLLLSSGPVLAAEPSMSSIEARLAALEQRLQAAEQRANAAEKQAQQLASAQQKS